MRAADWSLGVLAPNAYHSILCFNALILRVAIPKTGHKSNIFPLTTQGFCLTWRSNTQLSCCEAVKAFHGIQACFQSGRDDEAFNSNTLGDCVSHAASASSVRAPYTQGRERRRFGLRMVNWVNCPRRTDDPFVSMSDEEHHIESSPLKDAGIGMVSRITHKQMYLVFHGVMLQGPVDLARMPRELSERQRWKATEF